MRADAAIIGGTGIGPRLAALGGESLHVPTPFGTMRGAIADFGGRRVALISRHSSGHKTPPHLVDYRAVAAGVSRLGARACFATAAVGSLRDDWGMGTLCVCSDFLDFTGRNLTMFDRSVVHTDFSEPFDLRARAALLQGSASSGVAAIDGGVYINGNGPRYETPFEIRWYRSLGGDVVGMTAASEAVSMREAAVPYACLAVVTNLASGLSGDPLSHEEVVEGMSAASERVVTLLEAAVRGLS